MMEFSIVLPCYNEANSLASLLDRAVQCAQKRSLSAKQFQLILVNNGSSDNSLDIMQALTKSAYGNYLKIVNVPQNVGYGHGLQQGIIQSKSEFVAWSHADEQCDLEDAFKGYDLLKENNNLFIKGTRKGRSSAERFISKSFAYLASIIFCRRISEINAQPKVFHRDLLERIQCPPDGFEFDLYVLLEAIYAGKEVHELEVLFPERKYGLSNWSATFLSKYKTIAKMIQYMLLHRIGLR